MRIRQWSGRLREFGKDESGRVLIEASLTMPLILLCTVVFLAAGYTAYQRATMTQRVFEWTERAAYVWKDSHKDPVTGAFSYQEMDGIYGRMLSEGLGWMTATWNGFQQAELKLPARSVSGSKAPSAKLFRSSKESDRQWNGQVVYRNKLLEGELRAEWKPAGLDGGRTPVFFRTGPHPVRASAFIMDPVELLRTLDLVRTYTSKLKARFSTPSSAAEELRGLLPEEAARPVIRSEKQAKEYIRQMVGGASHKVTTSYGVRHIDVLDTDGIMHEAKYTVNKTDAKTQLKKDAELIRTGVVQGVVWHFFPLERTGQCDITPALRKELEANGILVVIH